MNLPQDAIYYKGDSVELEFQLWVDKSKGTYWDLTNHQIRFQLNSPTPIKKATANVSGGGDDQINITNAAQGLFVVIITKAETDLINPGDYEFEVEITTPAPTSARYTVLQSYIRLLQAIITWTNE